MINLQLLAFLLILACASVTSSAQAQEPSSIPQLQDDIAKLSLVDRSPDTPQELKLLNRSVLDERKNRLRTSLVNRISALNNYRRIVVLSETERSALDDAIRSVERALRQLDQSVADPNSTTMGTTSVMDSTTAGSSLPANATVPPAHKSATRKTKGKPDVLTIRVDTQVKVKLNDLIREINTVEGDKFEIAVSDAIQQYLPKFDRKQKDYYCVVHIVRWTNVEDGTSAKVQQDGWFLYKSTKPDAAHSDTSPVWKQQQDSDGKRIYGIKSVGLLIFHIDAPCPGAGSSKGAALCPGTDISYKITINKKTPAPVSDVLTLIGNIATTKAALPIDKEKNNLDLYATQILDVEDVPSDLVITASMAIRDQQSQILTRTYDNEGRYHWDVSVGVPVKTIRELQFSSDGNKVTASGQDRQNVYGFLNIYPWAVDVKNDNALTPPHFVFGVPLASKPLHHPFAGIGVGVYKAPIKFNVFAGVVFNRELVPRTLTTGDTATPSQLESDLHPRWVRKFTWGINFPIGQIKDAIKK